MNSNSPYYNIKRKIIFDILDKFPDTSIRSLAKIVYAEAPQFFKTVEAARTHIRFYKSKLGAYHRKYCKITKYYKNEVQST